MAEAAEAIGEYVYPEELVLGDMDYDDGAAVEAGGHTTISASPIRHALWRMLLRVLGSDPTAARAQRCANHAHADVAVYCKFCM